MERRNRNLLIVLIAVVIAVAVFSSFGLPFFAPPTATITLPTPVTGGNREDETGRHGGSARVEVTPETVQSVIAAMDRTESYSRTVTTTLEGRTATASVWADGGWAGSEITLPGGQVVCTITGDDTVWRWYEGDRSAVSWSVGSVSVDIEGQRLPTYEAVLMLDPEEITAAGYEEKNGEACVYVEVYVSVLDQWERYWVSADNGLLTAAETETGAGDLVWTMAVTETEIPISRSAGFVLPDGTVLHEVGE